MSAPLGNVNGQVTWFKPIADEPTEKVQTRIPRSWYQQMQGLLGEQTISEFVRDAIAEKLKRAETTHQNCQNQQDDRLSNICPTTPKINN